MPETFHVCGKIKIRFTTTMRPLRLQAIVHKTNEEELRPRIRILLKLCVRTQDLYRFGFEFIFQ